MILLATLPRPSCEKDAGFNSSVETGLSVTKSDKAPQRGFFSSVNSVLRSGRAWCGYIYARQPLRLLDQPYSALYPLIGINGVGYLTTTKSTHTMPIITATFIFLWASVKRPQDQTVDEWLADYDAAAPLNILNSPLVFMEVRR